MSDFTHVNSLRAAKSKANYLFEGEFRRKPSQNLSGASKSLARNELLQQAAEERQNREDVRKKELASLKIQSFWKGYCCRKLLSTKMRAKFDTFFENFEDSNASYPQLFDAITREFILFYSIAEDRHRFTILMNHIMNRPNEIKSLVNNKDKIWFHKLMRLLVITIKYWDKDIESTAKYLKFLDCFTSPEIVANNIDRFTIWKMLINNRFYMIIRKLIDSINLHKETSQAIDELESSFIELVCRSLNPPDNDESLYDTNLLLAFFKEFLKGPLSLKISDNYLPKLMELKPKALQAKYILTDQILSSDYTLASALTINSYLSTNPITECGDYVWLCYSFLKIIHFQIDDLSSKEKSMYLRILSKLIGPAEYITNLSLMEAVENHDEADDVDETNNSDDGLDPITINHINQYYTEINSVITKLVNIFNDVTHINGLKSIIFNDNSSDLEPIVQISNLMLSREPMAIFNCRLLYSVAFSSEFMRSLWRSIITSKLPYAAPDSLIYTQLAIGNDINREGWKIILPKLRLFCSLYSYLLPTIDDEEFYSASSTINEDSTDISSEPKNLEAIAKKSDTELDYISTQTSGKNKASRSYFTDKELVTISGILRDICVGFIDILYQDNKVPNYHYQSQSNKLLSFEMKLCFKAIVRLICQLHARDSRKQFCPDGHWISQIALHTNKTVDVQLLSRQQGRLLRQMTKDDRGTASANEIKTALILQEIPFVFPFRERIHILHDLLRREKMIHQSDMANYHFGLPGGAIMVQIRRNYIYEDAFEKLSTENEPNMKLALKVSLINALGAVEAGIDGGGVTKEFISELLKSGFDPMRGFFKSTKDQLLYPNPSANVLFANLPEGYGVHYEFLGRILGKAIFEKIMVELPLASFFLAKLLARRHSSNVDLHNLASLDPVLYKNLVYLKNYKGDVADLNLDFTISNNEFDEHEIVELKPGGSNIVVTKENRIEYVHLVADYRLNKQIRGQCAAFKRGIGQLIDLDWLRMFDSRELQILISGVPTMIDVEDWKRHTSYANGYSDDCGVIRTFWKVVDGLNEQSKRKLLKFATSCSLPPLLGFKDLIPQFTIAPSEEERLPTASTCINLLKLPACEDEVTLRSKLLYAIDSNAGFELS